MAGAGFKFDIAGFQRQIEKKKKDILAGVEAGFKDGSDCLEGIMKFYIDAVVYKVYDPKMYERTYDLRESVTAKVINNAIYVYVDDSKLDKPNGQWSYAWRVILGDDFYPYDYPVEGAAFMESRDFREATKMEFVEHMNQSQQFLNIVRLAIQKRL